MYNKLETPCFILDEDELTRSISGFQRAMCSRFDYSIIGYSVKTNSLPRCLSVARENGAFAEVVSHDEYRLARLCGFPTQHIIYNGPMKSKETFIEAIEGEAIVNIEAKRELQWLEELPHDKVFKVGLRLNCNISHVSPEDADGENDNSRFGFSHKTDELKDALDIISRLPNVELAGLHLHRTAHSRSVRFYRNLVAKACEIVKQYNLHLDYIDVGGGYYGIFHNKPTYQDYADAIHEVLNDNDMQHMCVIVEPGNALVASCFKFLSEVIDVKHVERDTYFITTDGSRNDIDPFFRKSNYLHQLPASDGNDCVAKQIVGGCTCLENDRLFEIENGPLLRVGDRILFNNVGAYTMCLSPMFIRYIPCVYALNDGAFTVVRKKWTATEYIINSQI